MRTAALAIFALLVGTAYAEDKPAAGAAAPVPKPAAELERLKPLEGIWVCKGVAPAGSMGPGSPEMKYASTFTVKRAFDGFAYTMTYDQKKSKEHPMHLTGTWHVGWDGTQKKFIFYWLDNMGSVGTQSASDWTGDDFVIAGEGYGMGAHSSLRDTLTRKGDKGLHWKGEFKPQGAPGWATIGEDDCTKK